MNEPIIYPATDTPVLRWATDTLRSHGIAIADAPAPNVTHLLLPIPTRTDYHPLLRELPPNVTLIGGGLDVPSMDLLKDEIYLAKNAMITAHVALTLAAQSLPITLAECPVLILGFGRIGKCLARLLQATGACVTVAARKIQDRAMAQALGYGAVNIQELSHILCRYRIIMNTVPYPVLSLAQQTHCRPDCVKLELASTPGIEGDAIQARGLPGKYAPESSGRLIGQTILRLLAETEVSR